jgi:DNA-binding NtrC family response regulator
VTVDVGSARELENAIERALVLCEDTITFADLSDRLREAGARDGPVRPTLRPSAAFCEHVQPAETPRKPQMRPRRGGYDRAAADTPAPPARRSAPRQTCLRRRLEGLRRGRHACAVGSTICAAADMPAPSARRSALGRTCLRRRLDYLRRRR